MPCLGLACRPGNVIGQPQLLGISVVLELRDTGNAQHYICRALSQTCHYTGEDAQLQDLVETRNPCKAPFRCSSALNDVQ